MKFADYNKIFYNILKLSTHSEQIWLAQFDEGNEPQYIENSKLTRPYSPDDTWITYRFNQVSSYIVNNDARVYYDLHVNVIGKDCDELIAQMKLRLEKQELLNYYANNNIGIETSSVPVVASNVEINQKWYNRRMLRFRFNFIETLEDKEELKYFDKLNDINIEEV